MSKHTQGRFAPWHIVPMKNSILVRDSRHTDAGACHVVAKVGGAYINDDEREDLMTNAHLIAAAPELLERLKQSQVALRKSCWCGETQPEYPSCAACNAASVNEIIIAKAEGGAE